jgi:myo-inositol-1(or 4)-monophosphatase
MNFGGHVWDHAAGVTLVRAAGGIVTDLTGKDWAVGSRGVLAGSPGVHTEMLDILLSVGAPEDY